MVSFCFCFTLTFRVWALYTCSSRTFHWPSFLASSEHTKNGLAGRVVLLIINTIHTAVFTSFLFFPIHGFDVVYMQQQNLLSLTSSRPPQNTSKDGLRGGVVLLMAYTVHILPFLPPIIPIFWVLTLYVCSSWTGSGFVDGWYSLHPPPPNPHPPAVNVIFSSPKFAMMVVIIT